MAATKRSIAESEESRSIKKSKIVDNDDVSEKRVKKEKKEKKEKKDKKRKAEVEAEVETPAATDSDQVMEDSDEAAAAAAKKARKEEKKKLKEAKKAKKQQEEVAAMEEDPAEEEEAPKPKKEKKDKSKKKNKASDAPAPAPSSGDATKYQQTAALSAVPQADIDAFLAKEHITIADPRNADVTLRPILEFAQLPPTDLLTKKGTPFANYKAPTPIQAASWPFTLSGRDVVGVAETGSGKTMAFALPCVQAVARLSKGYSARAVVVSPTRELAMQTHEQLASLAALSGLHCVCLYGGASKDEQRALLSRGADIIVATPGRLKDFMSDDTVNLSGCEFVVLDEADRMLDKGFEEDIKMILGSCPDRASRQTLMFTATWPYSVQSLASTFMVEPVRITIGKGGKESADGGVELQANQRITQTVEVLEGHDKEFRLMQVLKEHQAGSKKNDRILVFCLYKKEATRVENMLSRKGVRVGGIHGDLRQEQRTKSLEAFKSGATPVLVATDVAARGLDIPEVKLVINVTVCFLLLFGFKTSMLTALVSPDN